jgi:hypothetical protein
MSDDKLYLKVYPIDGSNSKELLLEMHVKRVVCPSFGTYLGKEFIRNYIQTRVTVRRSTNGYRYGRNIYSFLKT